MRQGSWIEDREDGSKTGILERLCGRPFSLDALQAIKEEVQGGYSVSRMEIARRVCSRLNWGNTSGQPQLMSCRVGLLRLHRLGLIELPPPLRRNGNGKGLVRQKAKHPQLSILEADLQSLVGWPTEDGGLCIGLEILWTNTTGNTEREKMCINIRALPWAILSQPYWGGRKLTLPLDYPDYHL